MAAGGPLTCRGMSFRHTTAALTVALAASAGCASGSSGGAASSTPTPTLPTSESPSATPTSSTPTPTSAPGSGGGRLAFVAKKQMYVVRISGAGKPVGLPGLVGPADARSRPTWSPLGRYLVWTWNDLKSHSDNPTVVELYDTTAKRLIALRNLNVGDTAATGTGAQVVEQERETGIVNMMYDGHGHGHAAGRATFKQLINARAVGHREALVETGDLSNGAKPATLWLLPPTGAPVKISNIPPLHFLGTNVPALGWTASANDGRHAAFVTSLGQDGACAEGQSVHLVDLDAKTDVAVALPYKDGDLRTPSYSPSGVLGGILDECGSEGPDTNNAFVELRGSTWSTIVTGATLGARGPGGLLAVQLGTLPKRDYAEYVSQDHPLQIRSESGDVTASLPTATAVAWTQAAVPPRA